MLNDQREADHAPHEIEIDLINNEMANLEVNRDVEEQMKAHEWKMRESDAMSNNGGTGKLNENHQPSEYHGLDSATFRMNVSIFSRHATFLIAEGLSTNQ
ncbi:unnamed protein product, partial [Mesorhabditis belari]|uniref:Uncharacterized protein n=1 Tax=Mesorhabditis belari TaxID=2138241 RepID=A0AAF3ERD6_9BILA